MNHENNELAFVLSGGGARGALQVGAVRALFERGIRPDLLAGSSAGAANAVFLGLEPSLEQVACMEAAWREAADYDFFPPGWFSVLKRAALYRLGVARDPTLRKFLLRHLPHPGLTFGDLQVPTYLVAADLEQTDLTYFGDRPEDLILEGLLASTALPPWIRPREAAQGYLIDGGAVSNLPIDVALAHGAGEVIALDVSQPPDLNLKSNNLTAFIASLLSTVGDRETDLELRLAASQGVTVHHLKLEAPGEIGFLDFEHPDQLIESGYRATQEFIQGEWGSRGRGRPDRVRVRWPVKQRGTRQVAKDSELD